MSTMKTDEPKLLRWTRDDYYRIAETGVFDGRRVELIKGEILEMTPQKSEHAAEVMHVNAVLREIFEPRGFSTRVQLPLDLGEDSEPEPDIAVVRGKPLDYRAAHPRTAVLVIEVADTTLASDRTIKARLYASAGILDYWIINLVDRQLELHRNPTSDPSQPYGVGYSEVTRLTTADSVSPQAAPEIRIAVRDLLP
jgi:Uma2 family endonuclease